MQFTLVSLLVAAGPALVAAQTGAFKALVGYNSLGCYDEPQGVRTLNVPFADQAAMTVKMCASLCSGYTYVGVEYGIECYCGNTLNGGALNPDASKCDIACIGDATENCGGHNTLSLYILNGNTIPAPAPAPVVVYSSAIAPLVLSSSTMRTSTTTAVLSSSSIPKSSSAIRTSTVVAVVISSTKILTPSSTFKISTIAKSSTSAAMATGFSYVGCFKDKGNVATIVARAALMNPSICMAAAKAKETAAKPTKFLYVGVEAGSVCIGATKEPANPTSLTGPKACPMTCVGAGNAAQTCGGKAMYNLYASVTGSAFSAPVKTMAA